MEPAARWAGGHWSPQQRLCSCRCSGTDVPVTSGAEGPSSAFWKAPHGKLQLRLPQPWINLPGNSLLQGAPQQWPGLGGLPSHQRDW